MKYALRFCISSFILFRAFFRVGILYEGGHIWWDLCYILHLLPWTVQSSRQKSLDVVVCIRLCAVLRWKEKKKKKGMQNSDCKLSMARNPVAVATVVAWSSGKNWYLNYYSPSTFTQRTSSSLVWSNGKRAKGASDRAKPTSPSSIPRRVKAITSFCHLSNQMVRLLQVPQHRAGVCQVVLPRIIKSLNSWGFPISPGFLTFLRVAEFGRSVFPNSVLFLHENNNNFSTA